MGLTTALPHCALAAALSHLFSVSSSRSTRGSCAGLPTATGAADGVIDGDGSFVLDSGRRWQAPPSPLGQQGNHHAMSLRVPFFLLLLVISLGAAQARSTAGLFLGAIIGGLISLATGSGLLQESHSQHKFLDFQGLYH